MRAASSSSSGNERKNAAIRYTLKGRFSAVYRRITDQYVSSRCRFTISTYTGTIRSSGGIAIQARMKK